MAVHNPRADDQQRATTRLAFGTVMKLFEDEHLSGNDARARCLAYCNALDAAHGKAPYNVGGREGFWRDLVGDATHWALHSGLSDEVVRFLIAVHLGGGDG
jgi:hypothetical protein